MFKMSGKKKNIQPFKKSNEYWNHIRSLIIQNTTEDQDICKKYGAKTLVSGWYLEHSALPFDYPSPKKSNSTYKRLGTINEPVSKLTSSQEDQIKALNPENYRIPKKPRKMLNMMSFPTTFGSQREEASKLAGYGQQDSNFTNIQDNYKTVMQCDYVYAYPQKPAPFSWNYFELETKHRRCHTAVVGKSSSKFLDDIVILKKHLAVNERPYGLDYEPEDTWKIINMDRKAN